MGIVNERNDNVFINTVFLVYSIKNIFFIHEFDEDMTY